MEVKVHIDFETYSELDIKKVGAYKMLSHPSSDVICLAYHISDKPPLSMHNVDIWVPGMPVPKDLINAIESGLTMVAFSAQFERQVFKKIMGPKYKWPIPSDSQWECCQARSSYTGLPRGLEEACKAISLDKEYCKDAEGHKIMLKVCKPKKGKRNTDPQLLSQCYSYCQQDVVAECYLYYETEPLPQIERELWILDQKINDRGVPLDLKLCQGAVTIMDDIQAKYSKIISDLTGGVITKPTQVERIKDKLKELGIDKVCLDKEAVTDLLLTVAPDSDAGALLKLRQAGASAAGAKFRTAVDWAGMDNRARGTLKYYAAGPGRWGGAGVQFQNLKHGKPVPAFIDVIKNGDIKTWNNNHKDPFEELSKYVRAMVCAPDGRVFDISDLNAIEFRLSCWLAGQQDMLDILIAGGDLYKSLAAQIYAIEVEDVTRDQREIGKNGRLQTIYGAGWGKFQGQMKAKFGIILDEQLCRTIVDLARKNIPKVCDYWRELAEAAKMAVVRGEKIRAKKIWFYMKGKALICRLPNGRELFYQKPDIKNEINKFGKRQTNLYYQSHKGPIMMGGWVWMENVGQGTARDLLAEAMTRLEYNNIYTVMHEHDKVVVERFEGDEETPKIVQECMEFVPDWAEGLPIRTETVTSKRFCK